jgi:hypothetical protein
MLFEVLCVTVRALGPQRGVCSTTRIARMRQASLQAGSWGVLWPAAASRSATTTSTWPVTRPAQMLPVHMTALAQ